MRHFPSYPLSRNTTSKIPSFFTKIFHENGRRIKILRVLSITFTLSKKERKRSSCSARSFSFTNKQLFCSGKFSKKIHHYTNHDIKEIFIFFCVSLKSWKSEAIASLIVIRHWDVKWSRVPTKLARSKKKLKRKMEKWEGKVAVVTGASGRIIKIVQAWVKAEKKSQMRFSKLKIKFIKWKFYKMNKNKIKRLTHVLIVNYSWYWSPVM